MNDSALARALRAEGLSCGEIAEKLEVSIQQVAWWCRFPSVEDTLASAIPAEGATAERVAQRLGMHPKAAAMMLMRFTRTGSLTREAERAPDGTPRFRYYVKGVH